MHYLHAGGHRLEYKFIHTTAAGERPVLVFLHEGLGSMAQWKDFPEAVVEATGCSALVYSRYGYGRSDPLTEARKVDYMHLEALEVLPEVLAAWSIEKPVLVGHSDGAFIVLIHAGAGRWPVRGLVLMALHVFVEDITVASIAQAKVTFESTDLAVKLGRYHDDAVSTFWGWNRIWLHPDFRAWNIEEYLPRITAPVLLIQGEDDQYGTQAQIEAIRRQMKGPVESVVLPRCAHSPQVDQKDATLQAIAAFVGALASASSASSPGALPCS